MSKTGTATPPWRPQYGRLLAHATALRLLPERSKGVTSYYKNAISGRLAAAEAQLSHHGSTRCLLEIGCGRDLLLALVAAIRHGKEVVAFDVTHLADLSLVNFTLAALGAAPVPSLDELYPRHGIRYVVSPSISTLSPNFDGVASSAAIEHIPPSELSALVACLAKVLRPGAKVTAEVDYRDHWSFIAPVPTDHFLTFSAVSFRLINVPRMFQNRLRHVDVVKLFHDQGFNICAEALEPMKLTVPRNRYAKLFRHRTNDELRIGVARIAWYRSDTTFHPVA